MKRTAVNIFIAVYLLTQLILVITCYFRDPKFFGWQMFSHAMIYNLRYSALGRDGRAGPFPEDLLKSFPSLVPHYDLGPPSKQFKVNSRGESLILRDLPRLPSYLCEKLKERDFQRVIVTIDYRDVREKSFKHRQFETACGSHI